MKKIKILVASLLCGGFAYRQAPIGSPPSPATVPNNANAAWYRGGNNIGGTNPVGANIFGTMWNSPVYHYDSTLAGESLVYRNSFLLLCHELKISISEG